MPIRCVSGSSSRSRMRWMQYCSRVLPILARCERPSDSMAISEASQPGGLAHGPEVLEYLWEAQVCAVAADNPAVEQLPFDLSAEAWPYGFLHQCLIGQLGLALGELWWLHDLAAACRRYGRYEVFLTAAPLHLPGGIGSPANALAVL